MHKTPLALALFLALAAAWVHAADTLPLVVTGGKTDLTNTPVFVPVSLPAAQAKQPVRVRFKDQTLIGQLSAPRLLAPAQPAKEGHVARELCFIVPSLKAGEKVPCEADLSGGQDGTPKAFHWHDTPGKSTDLIYGDRPVLRYMYEKLDASTPERRSETMKVYHHLFDPTGAKLVTKGPGGKFPHHRGLFYGFNRISYEQEGKKLAADVWHCNGGESQAHEKVLSEDVGPVFGRHRVAVAWHGKDGKVFAREERELTAYNTQGGTLVEFASRLSSAGPTITLDGDPQHAGFQFRASQEVPDKTAKLTYYVRPDGKGEPGKFRNWPQDKTHANLPWHALSFVLGDQRYTCCYLDRPENPKESRFSERDYGRFGSYFVATVEPEKPLGVNYRVWLQEGEMTVDEVAAKDAAFVDGPRGNVAQ